MKIKKIILISIICCQVIVGSIFLFNKYSSIQKNKKILGTIDSNNIVVPEKKIIELNEETLFDFDFYYELEPNQNIQVKEEWMDKLVNYTINQDGLNDKTNYPLEKKDGSIRIIAIGDSFTYGSYVNTDESWPEQMEKMLISQSKCPIEVINLGLGAADIPYLVKRYRDIGAKYNPDIILWYESGSGFNRMAEEIFYRTKNCNNDLEKENLKNKDVQIQIHSCWYKANQDILKEIGLQKITEHITFYLDFFFSKLTKEQEIYYFTSVSSLPENEMSTYNYWKKRYPQTNFTEIQNIPSNNYRLLDGHPNAKGHTFIAEQSIEVLKKSSLMKDCIIPK